MAFLETEFVPCAPLGHPRVDFFDFGERADAACGFDFLASFIEGVGDYRFGAVFVCGNGLGGKRGGAFVKLLVIGPVAARGRVVSDEVTFGEDRQLTWRF